MRSNAINFYFNKNYSKEGGSLLNRQMSASKKSDSTKKGSTQLKVTQSNHCGMMNCGYGYDSQRTINSHQTSQQSSQIIPNILESPQPQRSTQKTLNNINSDYVLIPDITSSNPLLNRQSQSSRGVNDQQQKQISLRKNAFRESQDEPNQEGGSFNQDENLESSYDQEQEDDENFRGEEADQYQQQQDGNYRRPQIREQNSINQSKNSIQFPEQVMLTAGRVLQSEASQDQSEHGNVNEEANHEGGAILTTDYLSKHINMSPFDKKSNFSLNNSPLGVFKQPFMNSQLQLQMNSMGMSAPPNQDQRHQQNSSRAAVSNFGTPELSTPSNTFHQMHRQCTFQPKSYGGGTFSNNLEIMGSHRQSPSHQPHWISLQGGQLLSQDGSEETVMLAASNSPVHRTREPSRHQIGVNLANTRISEELHTSMCSQQIDSDEERPKDDIQSNYRNIETSLNTKMHVRHTQKYISPNRRSTQSHTEQQYLEVPILQVKEDPVLFQGELLKLKPGLRMEFQPRWIQVSKHSLRYYKNRWTKNSALLKPLGAIPIDAISRLSILGAETISVPLAPIKQEQFYFEVVLKEDFLSLYLDPYYDIYQSALSTDQECLKLTITKKKKELAVFQDRHLDYFSQPLGKTKLIERYLKCTAEPINATEDDNDDWRKIEESENEYTQEVDGLIIGEETPKSVLRSTSSFHTPLNKVKQDDSRKELAQTITMVGAGNTNKFTELSQLAANHNPYVMQTKITTVNSQSSPERKANTSSPINKQGNTNSQTQLKSAKSLKSRLQDSKSPYQKFHLKGKPSETALNRFSTSQPDPTASKFLTLEQSQHKSLKQAKNAVATGKITMSERQSEWFLTDKRLIFACNNFTDFKLWVTKIEELIQEVALPAAGQSPQQLMNNNNMLLTEHNNTMMNNIKLFSYNGDSPNKSFASIPLFTQNR